MPSTELLLAFFATTAIFAAMPGPAVLYTTARTMAGGRRAGLFAVLGIHLGGYVHVAAATAGLSALFHAVPMLYLAVKLAGAAYLVWLGLSMFLANPPTEDDVPVFATKSSRHAFVESVVVEVLNPKTALFFAALLPQFVDPGASFSVPVQFAVLGILTGLMFTLSDIVYVLLAAVLMKRLKRSSRVQRALQRMGGSILMGLGAHMALQKA